MREAFLPGAAGAVEGVERDRAQEAAREELSRSIYAEAQPGLLERALDWLVEQVLEVLDTAGTLSPGGLPGLLGALLLVLAVVVLVRWRTGPLARSAVVLEGSGGRLLSAADHRRLADEAAETERWAEAVRERMRALVRELELRGVLEPRAGRTASEIAAEAGAAVPAVAEGLHRAARVFDEIWYGGRPATREAAEQVRAVDESVRSARLSVTGPAAGPGQVLPR